MRLTSGILGLVAALTVALPAGAAAADQTVECVGGSDRCVATVSLEGATTGDQVIVQLSDTDLQLWSIVPSDPSLTAVYGFGGFSERLGGSEFVANLLILGPVSAGASLAMTFATPPRMRACGATRFKTGGAVVRLRAVQAHGFSCRQAKRIARSCVAGTGPGRPGWTIFEVDERVTLRRGQRLIAFTLGNLRASCAPSG